MEVQQSQRRRPRYRRNRHVDLPFVLQERDREVIRVVADHRAISSEDLRVLIPGSDQGILRRLQKLFHAGYLDRPRSQRAFGNAAMVYALGDRGADLLAGHGSRPRGIWSEKNRQIGVQYLDHILMISRFRTALSCACSQRRNVVLDRWLPDGQFRDAVHVSGAGGPERIPVVPDAVLTLALADQPEGRNRIHAFLEADRGTMTRERFLVKLRGYFAYWRNGKAAQRLGVKNFLVLTVTGSAERAAGLLETCRAVNDVGLRPFLFTSEVDYLPATSMSLLQPIWRTPADRTVHSILE